MAPDTGLHNAEMRADEGEVNMGRYVAYIGAYTTENNKGLYILDVDEENGCFIERKALEMDNPAHLCVSNSGKYLYCTTDMGVNSFRIQKDGELEKINSKWTGGLRGAHISTDSEDKYLFIAGYYDGRVTVMHLKEDGSVGEIADAVFHKGMGRTVGRRNIEPHVNCVCITPDQKYLCAVDNGMDCIKVYQFDKEKGKIELADNIHLPLETGPRHMTFSADGRFAYVIMELAAQISVFSYKDTPNGPEFEKLQTIRSLDPADMSPSAGVEVMISPDEKQEFIFTSNAGSNTTAMFGRSISDGYLTFLGNGKVGGQYPKTISIFPDQQHFASLNYDSNEVTFFKFVNDHKNFLECAKPISIMNPNTCRIVDLDKI